MNLFYHSKMWGFLTPVIVGLTASLAFAASVHLKQNQNPTFVDQILTLQTVGALSGLGNGDVVVSLTATGNPTATCTNPGTGEHQPAGQNPASVTLTGVQAIPEDQIKNGNLAFNVATNAPTTPVPGAPECPNSHWAESITDVAFTTASIKVEQPAGTTVLTVNCTFSSPTANGSVPRGSVTCSSS
jgi:hypothetical protein